MEMLRMADVEKKRGLKKSHILHEVTQGLFPKPVKIGKRATAWPDHEVDAINLARIAGKSDDEIRQLVCALHAARTTGAVVQADPFGEFSCGV